MKTEQAIRGAIATYEQELARLQGNLEDVERAWKKAGLVLDNPEFFVSCIKEREHLTKQIEQFDFKIRFAKWVLDEKD
jgi:hypothetical protein